MKKYIALEEIETTWSRRRDTQVAYIDKAFESSQHIIQLYKIEKFGSWKVVYTSFNSHKYSIVSKVVNFIMNI